MYGRMAEDSFVGVSVQYLLVLVFCTYDTHLAVLMFQYIWD